MKTLLKTLTFLFLINIGYSQKITVNADKYTIKGTGTKQTKFYTNKAFFNTLIVGDTSIVQSEPFRITTNSRFDGKISLSGNYGTSGTYFRSSGNSSNPTWSAIDWSEIVNKPVFGNYVPFTGGTMSGELILNNSIRIGGRFGSVWFGKNALIGHTSGSYNTAIGEESMPLLTGANYNTALGATTLNKNKASGNTAIGGVSMSTNTTGQYNTALGISSLSNNVTGSYNVAVGSYAGQFLLGTGNAIFGGYTATSERNRQNSMFLGNGSGALHIFGDSLNNIGIGTTRPKTKLQINYDNSISYTSNYPTGYGSIHLQPLGSGSTGISFGANTTSGGTTSVVNAGIHVASNISYGTRMRFSTSNNITNGALSRMIIDENGKVGIGNDTPAEMLDVTGNLKVSAEIRNTYLGFGIVHSSSIGTFSSSLLVNQDISNTANINIIKLGTGLIDNNEFNNLDGVIDNIQSQFDLKLNTLTASNIYATKKNPLIEGRLTISQYVDENNEVQLPILKIGNSNSPNSILKATGTNGEYGEGVINADEIVGLSGVYALSSNVNTLLAKKANIENTQLKGAVEIVSYVNELSELIPPSLNLNGNFSLGGISNVEDEIASKLSITNASSTYGSLSANNNFTGINKFLTPVFANSVSTSSFSSMTPEWTNTGNLGTFRWKYNTKVGSNTVTWYPLNIDTNGWVGIGMQPTQAFEVLGASKFNSAITATTISASGAINSSVTSTFNNITIGASDIRSSSNILTLGGTSERIRIDASGNVGVGVPAPNYKLDVNGTIHAQAQGANIRLKGDGTGAGDALLGVGGDNSIYVSDWNLTRGFKIYENGNITTIGSGNVGIGDVNPSEKLHVVGNQYTTGTVSTGTSFGAYNVNQLLINPAYGGSTPMIQVINAAPLGFATSNIERMRVDADGNVGIGSVNPTEKLVVSGSGSESIKIESTTNANWRGIKFGNQSTTHGSIRQRLDTGEQRYEVGFSGWGGFQTFYTDGLERLRINDNGNVGIGTSSPEQKLHIEGLLKIKSYTTTEINSFTGMTIGTITINSTIGLPIFWNGTAWKRFDGSNM